MSGYCEFVDWMRRECNYFLGKLLLESVQTFCKSSPWRQSEESYLNKNGFMNGRGSKTSQGYVKNNE